MFLRHMLIVLFWVLSINYLSTWIQWFIILIIQLGMKFLLTNFITDNAEIFFYQVWKGIFFHLTHNLEITWWFCYLYPVRGVSLSQRTHICWICMKQTVILSSMVGQCPSEVGCFSSKVQMVELVITIFVLF